jgi:hypothetical protein
LRYNNKYFLLFTSRALSLTGGVVIVHAYIADADERLVKPKILEWLRYDAASWHGGKNGLLLKCDGLDFFVFEKVGG